MRNYLFLKTNGVIQTFLDSKSSLICWHVFRGGFAAFSIKLDILTPGIGGPHLLSKKSKNTRYHQAMEIVRPKDNFLEFDNKCSYSPSFFVFPGPFPYLFVLQKYGPWDICLSFQTGNWRFFKAKSPIADGKKWLYFGIQFFFETHRVV